MRRGYIIWREERYSLHRQGRRDLVVRGPLRKSVQHGSGRAGCDRLCTACPLCNQSRVHARKVLVGEGKEGLLKHEPRETVGKQSYSAANDGFSVPAKVQIKAHTRLDDCALNRRGKAVVSSGKGSAVRSVQGCRGVRKPSDILRIATVVANGITVAIDTDAEVEGEVWQRPPLILGIHSKVIDGVVNVGEARKALAKGETSVSGQGAPSQIRDPPEIIEPAISGGLQANVGKVIPLEVGAESEIMAPFCP